MRYVSNLLFFRLCGYFSLLSRTELLTTLVSKSSFRKLKGDFNGGGDIFDSYHSTHNIITPLLITAFFTKNTQH